MDNDHRSFFLLNGKHTDLGNGELRSLIRSYQPKARIKNLGSRVVLADGELDIEKIMARAAYTKFAGKLLQVSSKAKEFELDGTMKNYKTFACELVNLSRKHVGMQVLSDMGSYVKQKAPWLDVSLENPDVTVLLIKTETEYVVGLVETKRSMNRNRKIESPRNRPYFHPVALEPKLCRVMINLAMVIEGSTILDPFCGTGSIMLEAASMNINAIGCDLSSKMCRGAMTNLSKNMFIINCDALSLPLKIGSIDAIVTDLPYGRAAPTMKRRPKELLNEFLDAIGDMKRKRCCIMCRKGDEQEFPNMVEQYDIYEHRNLTRKLMVLCN